jgi:ubiquinol-cytochrome c reductase iron-sulfur subunit
VSTLARMVGLALLALVGLRRRRRHTPAPRNPDRGPDPSRRVLPHDPRAELIVALLLVATGLCGAAVIVLLIVVEHHLTQWLGVAVGLGLASLSAALIVAGKRVVVQEVAVEPRGKLGDPEDAEEAAELLAEGTEGLSRRRLLASAAGIAAVGVGGALIAPAASLGPNVDDRIDATPWRRGRRVVDARGAPISADDVVTGTVVTGYAEGASTRDLASPIVIVRLDPAALHLPAGRDPARWAPEGLLAYSKICTHAGCPIALYRYPLYPPTEPRPALVCPCHYSTFDPARGAEVIFGPAGRPLPQLPLAIDPATRELRANGGYSGSIGPAWFDVNRGRA